MTGLSLFLGDIAILDQSLARTLAYALWYATLFWLPVRGLAAMIDHWRSNGLGELAAQGGGDDDCYRIGMEILPPM